MAIISSDKKFIYGIVFGGGRLPMNSNWLAEFGPGVEIAIDPETGSSILVKRVAPNQGVCIKTGRVIPIQSAPLKTANLSS